MLRSRHVRDGGGRVCVVFGRREDEVQGAGEGEGGFEVEVPETVQLRNLSGRLRGLRACAVMQCWW